MRYVKIAASSYKIFYHGTSSDKLTSILTHGLKKVPNKFNRVFDESTASKSLNNAYITSDLVEAIEYAYTAVGYGNKNASPILVVIKVDKNDNNLIIDEDNLSQLDEYLKRNYFNHIPSVRMIDRNICVDLVKSYLSSIKIDDFGILEQYKNMIFNYVKKLYQFYVEDKLYYTKGRKYIRAMMNIMSEIMRKNLDKISFNEYLFKKLCTQEISFTGPTCIVAIYKILKNRALKRIWGNKKYDNQLITQTINHLLSDKKVNPKYLPNYVENTEN